LTKMEKNKKRIVVRAFTPIAKPLNHSVQKTSTMLLLGYLPYKNGEKEHSTKAYFIKGVRGMLRHAAMSMARVCRIEVCHTSEKDQLKDGTMVIPVGFHALGACETPCIIRRIFGTFREESRIIVKSDPIVSIKHNSFEVGVPVQNVHISSEYRIAKAFDGTPIQDFRQAYFAGYFNFQIDVTQLDDDEIKFLLETLLYIETLGSGKNSGYGHIKVLDVELQEVTIRKKLVANGEKYEVQDEEDVTPIILNNIEDWRKKYLYIKTECEADKKNEI